MFNVMYMEVKALKAIRIERFRYEYKRSDGDNGGYK